MMFPTIHLNGTSGDDLLGQTVDAMLALSDAFKAIQAANPNGRDYYVQGPWAIDLAENEHRARLAQLEAVQADLVALYESIHAQMTERSRP